MESYTHSSSKIEFSAASNTGILKLQAGAYFEYASAYDLQIAGALTLAQDQILNHIRYSLSSPFCPTRHEILRVAPIELYLLSSYTVCVIKLKERLNMIFNVETTHKLLSALYFSERYAGEDGQEIDVKISGIVLNFQRQPAIASRIQCCVTNTEDNFITQTDNTAYYEFNFRLRRENDIPSVIMRVISAADHVLYTTPHPTFIVAQGRFFQQEIHIHMTPPRDSLSEA